MRAINCWEVIRGLMENLGEQSKRTWRSAFDNIDKGIVPLLEARRELSASRKEAAAARSAERVTGAYRFVQPHTQMARAGIEADYGAFSCLIVGFVKRQPPKKPRKSASLRELRNYRIAVRAFSQYSPERDGMYWLIDYLGFDAVKAKEAVEHAQHIGPTVILEGKSQALVIEVKKRLEVVGVQVKIHEATGARSGSGSERARREPLPESVRHEVWRRDGGQCVDCGSRERLEYDHIIPVSRGGSNTARNLELRCEACNRSKGSRI